MKVYTTIVDTKTGNYQFAMIEEPVIKGVEVKNALAHFGIDSIKKESESENGFIAKVEGTTKIVSVIIV